MSPEVVSTGGAVKPRTRFATASNTILLFLSQSLYFVGSMGLVLLVAHFYGASQELDAFLVAATIPTAIGQIVSGFAGQWLIPVIGRLLETSETDAWQLAVPIGLCFLALVLLVCACLWLAAPGAVLLLGPGMAAGIKSMSASLLRILLLSAVFSAIAGLLIALYYSYSRFLAPAWIRPFSIVVVAALLVGLHSHWGIRGYAWAVVIGQCTGMILLLPMLYGKRKLWLQPVLWSHPELRHVLFLGGVLLFTRIFDHLNLVITRSLASYLPTGSISALYYALAIAQVPFLLSMSLSTVLFPKFSSAVARRDWTSVSETLGRAMRMIAFLLFPATGVLLILRRPLVDLLFAGSRFSHTDLALTASCLLFYSAGIYFYGANSLLGTAMLAHGLVISRCAIELSGIAGNLLLSILLVKPFGATGLALAVSLSFVYLTLASYVAVRRKLLVRAGWGSVLRQSGLSLLAACVMLLFLGALFQLFRLNQTGSFVNLASRLAAAGGLAIAAYYFMARQLGLEAVQILDYFIKNRGVWGWVNQNDAVP